jgi:tRNA nucleotidyltransferase (CCA-adding enzyme)
MNDLNDLSEMDRRIDEVVKRIAERVSPSEDEVRRAKEVEIELRKRLDNLLKKYSGLRYEFLGSYARNTWLPRNLEIDVFILFPENWSTEELERVGLEIGKAVMDEYELRYAAHPYVHGKVMDVEVDVVPCFALSRIDRIKSAVDRTPFHHAWLKDRISGKEEDIRILKAFLKANGIYGAEYSVRGFSGYLCELLIVFYGTFRNLVKAARSWTRDTVIDIASGKVYRERRGFFVVDPVDVKRNVAANLSIDNLAKFVQLCREFVSNPSEEFFETRDVRPDPTFIQRELDERYIFAIEFERPDIVEDNLYPQLERAVNRINDFLERSGFSPIRNGFTVIEENEKCYLFFETEVFQLSQVEKRMGPPFEDEKHVKKFLSKDRGYKPFIEGGRWWCYERRKLRRVDEAVADYVTREWKGLGKNVGESLNRGFGILKGKELLDKVLKVDKLLKYLHLFMGGF